MKRGRIIAIGFVAAAMFPVALVLGAFTILTGSVPEALKTLSGVLDQTVAWLKIDHPPGEIEEAWSKWVKGYQSTGGTSSPYWYLLKLPRIVDGPLFSPQISNSGAIGGWRIEGARIGQWKSDGESVEVFLRENARWKVAPMAWDNHLSIRASSFNIEVVKRRGDEGFSTLVREELNSGEVVWETPADPNSKMKRTPLWASLDCAPSGFVSVSLEGTRRTKEYLTSVRCGDEAGKRRLE